MAASSTPAPQPNGTTPTGGAPDGLRRWALLLVVAQVAAGAAAVVLGQATVAALVAAPAVGAHLLLRRADGEHRRARAELAARAEAAEARAAELDADGRLLVDLARRNQELLERQIDQLVAMEDEESDAEGLGRLFRLDHLATRMRRNVESLLVLSGDEPPRRWPRPIAVSDVVRAAVAEVEDFRRVDVAVEESLALVGRAVADVAHLLAELVENGLRCSPATSRVRVGGALAPDRSLLLTVEDRGVGMAPSDLAAANELLADPPAFPADGDRRLGFHVVARLGRRYRLRVQLVPTPAGGVTAEVLVPQELLGPIETLATVGVARNGGGR